MTSPAPQVVLVTGCSTGIGRALARELVAGGHVTFATARRPETLADLAAAGAQVLPLDVDDPASIAAAVADVMARAGRIDAVINNAGSGAYGPLVEIPLEQIAAVFRTNVLGVVAVIQAVFPHLADRRRGRIINIGSIVGVLPTPWAAPYCASKSAVHMLSEALRIEVAPFGIDVVEVQPAAVRSSIADSAAKDLDRYGAASSRFRAAHESIVKRAYASQHDPMPSEEFARRMIAACFADPAPRVVRLGARVEALAALAEADPATRDATVAAMFGVDRLRGRAP
jgi:NAD(P)-dependent dehydrogenase (short-subunit alcohol dehydrogenase family)